MKKYVKIALLAIVAVIFLGTFVFLYQKSQPVATVYEVLNVSTGDLERTTVATGKIEPRDEILIKPQISGIIDAIYTIASYTYGPLLGLFVFGLFTHLKPRDRFVPYVAIASPFICFAIDRAVFVATGYQFGYEMLMFNGFLTFVGLSLLSINNKKNIYGN